MHSSIKKSQNYKEKEETNDSTLNNGKGYQHPLSRKHFLQKTFSSLSYLSQGGVLFPPVPTATLMVSSSSPPLCYFLIFFFFSFSCILLRLLEIRSTENPQLPPLMHASSSIVDCHSTIHGRPPSRVYSMRRSF